MTASGDPANAANRAHSTYQYTNAVPQCGSFNTGQWRVWEGNIRTFAVQTCIPGGGALYLVTGISFVAIQPTPPSQPGQPPPLPQPIAVQIVQFAPGILKPNSMWTSGACLYPNGQCDSFAVLGSNVPNPPEMLTQEITLAHLDSILQFDIATNGLKRDRSSRRAGVFPGLRLPKEEYPPTISSGSNHYPSSSTNGPSSLNQRPLSPNQGSSSRRRSVSQTSPTPNQSASSRRRSATQISPTPDQSASSRRRSTSQISPGPNQSASSRRRSASQISPTPNQSSSSR